MSENLLFKTALNKATVLCSRRELCCTDIVARLQTWGVADADIEKIISVLIKENFINEERFSRAFVKDKFNYNKWGKVKIRVHLKAKNIQDEDIKNALDSIENEVYLKVLKDLIANHRKAVKAKNQYDLKAKMLRYGLSKGFESQFLYDVLNGMMIDAED